MFRDAYKNKKVLVTGHTGFKGGWLVTWLLELGAEVIGVSKDIPTSPSMFDELNLSKNIKHYLADIRNLSKMIDIVSSEKPDFVFHLAAQAIVSVSYSDSIETISSNVIGTTNILEALKTSNHDCIAIIITSDKVYDNIEQVWGYKENDKIGGKDVYSASKGAAELIIKSYCHSFFNRANSNIRLGIARAGNVIGGGDWAKDRLVVDCMKAWSQNNPVEIRSPKSTRPWQHVLEPLSGYLNLGYALFFDDKLHGEGFNFGPKSDQNHTVVQLLKDLGQHWNFKNEDEAFVITDNIPFYEAGLLKLNCDKSLFYLGWQANLDYEETIRFTSEWYYSFYKNNVDMLKKTKKQIKEYEDIASFKRLMWTE